ncbi:MAG: hypothetical protein ACJAVW_002392 [Spirosomataceae bacterium]|jgi:hypothetical protein
MGIKIDMENQILEHFDSAQYDIYFSNQDFKKSCTLPLIFYPKNLPDCFNRQVMVSVDANIGGDVE